MKDCERVRNDLPTGIVERIFSSDNGCVQNVDICIVDDSKRSSFVRLISKTVALLEID